MNEFDSPNYAEYSYEKKSEGKVKLQRRAMVFLYVAFFIGGFIACVATKFYPLFAIAPTLTLILVLCTWRLVKYDVYFEFREGRLELGKVRVTKQGRRKSPAVSIHIKEALYIAPYANAEQTAGVTKIYDYSESLASDKRVVVIFLDKGEKCAAIFEGTAKIAKLLNSFCPNAENMKGQIFHG